MRGQVGSVHTLSQQRFLCYVVLMTVVLGGLAAPASTNSAFAEAKTELPIPNPWADDGLEVLGMLPNPWADDPGSSQTRADLRFIDEERQRGYGTFLHNFRAYRLGEYDMSTDIPTPLRISDAPVTVAGTRDTMAIDHDRDRLLIIGKGGAGDRAMLDVIDLETLTRLEQWDMDAVLPGFVPLGMTLDEDRDRLFLAGEFTGNPNVRSGLDNLGNNPIGSGPSIVALDPQDGSLIWAAPLSQCHQILRAPTGTMVGVSIHHPSLYVFCTSGTAARQTTGQGGLLRVDVSGQEDAAGVVAFPSEFFPVSGQYAGSSNEIGLTGFDPTSDRFFAQSLAARTPGAWVFDGLRSAWVGFIAADDDTNQTFGLNTTNGRHYQAGSGQGDHGAYLNIADGRATPVPQGRLFKSPADVDFVLQDQIAVDGGTNRLFAQADVTDPETGDPERVLVVLRDNTTSIEPLQPTDLDARTHDLDDDEAFLVYAAGATGFGARYIAVGGWEGLYSRIRHPLNANSPLPVLGRNPADLSTGDRGMTFSYVTGTDLRDSGPSATAASSGVDKATASDAENSPNGGDLPATFVQFTDQSVSCLDGAGEAQEHSAGTDAGFAEVLCDLEERRVEARARHGEEVVFPGVSTARTSFETDAYQEPDGVTVNETTAIAEGISIWAGGEDVLYIDRITATLTVRADGRPGGSSAVWTRMIEGAAGPGGTQSCSTTVEAGAKEDSTGNCDRLAREINAHLGSRIQVSFPDPTVVATPRGAFAQVTKPESQRLAASTTNNDDSHALPAMELVYLNDHAEKSRMVVQYAAVNGFAQMVRTPLFGAGQTGQAGGSDGSQATGSADSASVAQQPASPSGNTGFAPDLPETNDVDKGGVAAPPPPDVAAPPPPVVASAPDPAVAAGGWVLVTRAPRDAALVALLLAMFILAPMEFSRRRRLLAEIA